MVKRVIFPEKIKVQVVYEVIGGVKSAAEVHREYNLKAQLLSRVSGECAKGVKYTAIIDVKVLKEAGLLSAWLKSVKLGRVAIVNSMYEPSSKMY